MLRDVLYRQVQGRVSILTGPWRPMLRGTRQAIRSPIPFQSSPAPGGRCYDAIINSCNARLVVSILTGPWRPMLPSFTLASGTAHIGFQSSPAPGGRCYVSLISRCRIVRARFNPHRPLEADATIHRPMPKVRAAPFQSSPAPGGRCYHCRKRERCSKGDCFNPHRPLEADATGYSNAQADC